MSATSPPSSPVTLILGGGIIGLSTAYYLSHSTPSHQIHILDSAPSLLLSASGYAGGFLAKDWFSPATSALGALSFDLHRELAGEFEGKRKWGYSASTAYGLSIDDRAPSKNGAKDGQGDGWMGEGRSRAEVAVKNGGGEMLNEDGTPAWITRQAGGTLEVISSDGGCAQVESRELCEWLIEEVQKKGVKIQLGCTVTGSVRGADGKVNGVRIQEGEKARAESAVECENIVITAGAWSSKLFKTLFPESKTRLGIGPLAGYSIVVRSPRYSVPIVDPTKHGENGDGEMCHSVFCSPGPNWSVSPEAIARVPKNGKPEIYVAGLNDSNMPLPPDVTAVKGMTDEKKAQDLKRATVQLTGLSKEGTSLAADDLEVVREGLCLRPVTDSGKPIVTKFTSKQLGGMEMVNEGGVFIAAGHGPWGISMSLGTGLVTSELILGKTPSADISGLGVR